MSKTRSLRVDVYREAAELQRIGSRAVTRAQEDSRRRKVPNVYSHNGSIYYELPDGQLSTFDPFDNGISR